MKVYVVEDSLLVRERLVTMLHSIAGVEVVGESDDAEGALLGILQLQPDAVVLDVRLRNGNGLDVLRGIRRTAPRTTAIVLTNHANPAVRRRCMQAGADHFFDKTDEFEQVGAILERATGRFRRCRSSLAAARRRTTYMYSALRMQADDRPHDEDRAPSGPTTTAGNVVEFERCLASPLQRGDALGATAPELPRIVVVDVHGFISFCTEAAARTFGGSVDMLSGRPIASLVPELCLKSGTPGYNVAYALFRFPHQQWRGVKALDCNGDALALQLSISPARIAGTHQLLLALHPAYA